MSIARIAHRYAKSLIDLSVEQDKLERTLEDVQSFREVSKNKDFRNANTKLLLLKNDEEFIQEYKKLKHITTVRVTTATPLSESAKKAIQTRLVVSNKTSDNVDLQTAIDPDLIGGYVLEFDGNVYDASIKHKLMQLKDDFDDNLYISQIFAR